MNGNKGSTAADRWGSPQGPRPMPILPRTQATATSDFKPFGSPSTSTSMTVHNHPSGTGTSSIKHSARSAVLSVNEPSTDLKACRPPIKDSSKLPSDSLSFTPKTAQLNNDKTNPLSISKVDLLSKATQGPKSNNVASEPSNGPISITTKDGTSVKTNYNYKAASVPCPTVNVVSSSNENSSTHNNSILDPLPSSNQFPSSSPA